MIYDPTILAKQGTSEIGLKIAGSLTEPDDLYMG